MNWKVIVLGGLAFFVATWIVMPITGPLLHDGVLKEAYLANAAFWRPELAQNPPDMAALMPMWIAFGLVGSLIVAGVYGVVRNSFAGPGWQRGLKYGIALSLLAFGWMLGYSGVFNLPYTIWAGWAVETLAMNLIGGLALGWVAEKVAPSSVAVPSPA
jgi:hypothetical protein